MAIDKIAGAKVYFDAGPILHLMRTDGPTVDIRLTPSQLQCLALDAVSVLLAHFKLEQRS